MAAVSLFWDTNIASKIHQERGIISSRDNKPIFFLMQTDLIDFRKITCNCSKEHTAGVTDSLHVENHYSKVFVAIFSQI